MSSAGGALPPLGNTMAPEGGAVSPEAGVGAGLQAGASSAGTSDPQGGTDPGGGSPEAGEEAGHQGGGGSAGDDAGVQAGEMMSELGPARDCAVLIRATSEREEPTFFASSVTSWGDSPIEMTFVGRDAEGRAQYELALSAREGLGLTLGLEEGVRYPYKLIQGGEWRLNEEASLQAFEGSCANSAFVIPSCEGPAA